MVGGVEHPGGMQGKEKPGKPGKLNWVPVTGGKPKMTIPLPSPPQSSQPTRTGTMVGSLEPSEVVVIHVLVVHSGWLETVVGAKPAGGTVSVDVRGGRSVLVAVVKGVEVGPSPASVVVVAPASVVVGGGRSSVVVGGGRSSVVVSGVEGGVTASSVVVTGSSTSVVVSGGGGSTEGVETSVGVSGGGSTAVVVSGGGSVSVEEGGGGGAELGVSSGMEMTSVGVSVGSSAAVVESSAVVTTGVSVGVSIG